MNKQDFFSIQESIGKIYNGIIANNPILKDGVDTEITYDFDCPQFLTLKSKYDIDSIAGKGTVFDRAKRLLNFLSPRLNHLRYYDNHIECNSLALLEYSLNNEHHGINCLNKSKILQECLLALGIYARRVFMMPYSPFDMDNHVVVEIFDRKLNKWIMLDPTTNCYVINKDYTPLSLMEMRNTYSCNEAIVPVEANKKKIDFDKQYTKHIELINYYAKNCFYFMIDSHSTFGVKEGKLIFAPASFNFGNWKYKNSLYRINYLEKNKNTIINADRLIENAKKRLRIAEENIDKMEKLNSLSSYTISPIK